MGWRYRRRARFGPLNINLSRRGVGTSWGIPGFRVTHTATGHRYLTLSVPGTGLSWQKTLRTRTSRTAQPSPLVQPSSHLPHPPLSQGTAGPGPIPPVSRPPANTSPSARPPLVNGKPWWEQPGLED